MASAMKATPQSVEANWQQIATRGYSVQPFLDPPEVEALKRLYDTTVPEVPSPFFLSVFMATDVRRTILQGFCSILNQKLAVLAPGFRIVGASFAVKKSGSVNGRLGLHQDCSLVDYDKHMGLNIWVPLCDVDSNNGCLRVAPYTQRLNFVGFLPPVASPCASFERGLGEPYLSALPMKAGDACVFDGRLFHASEENHSKQDRVAAFFNIIPADQPIRLNFRNPETPDRLDVYHANTEFILQFNPLIYPDEGQLNKVTYVESIQFQERKLSLADLAALHPKAEITESLAVTRSTEPSTSHTSSAPAFWARLLTRFRRGQQYTVALSDPTSCFQEGAQPNCQQTTRPRRIRRSAMHADRLSSKRRKL